MSAGGPDSFVSYRYWPLVTCDEPGLRRSACPVTKCPVAALRYVTRGAGVVTLYAPDRSRRTEAFSDSDTTPPGVVLTIAVPQTWT